MNIRHFLGLLVSLLAGVGVALAAGAGATKIPIVIDAPERSAAAALRVTVRSHDGVTLRTVLDPGNRETVLELKGEPPWRVRAEGEGLWGEERVCLSPTSAPLRLRLWDASGISGELRFPAGARAPTRIAVDLQPHGDGAASQAGLLGVACALEPEKPLSCQLPAGPWHIRLTVPGMVPHEFPAAVLQAGAPLHLGQITLAWGVEVTGRIDGLGDDEQRAAIRVRLHTRREGATSPDGESAILRTFVREATLDARSTFRFDGVAPGAYWLSAQHPSCPPLTARLLVSGENPRMDLPEPLILTCGARITVSVSPPDAILDTGLALSILGEHSLLGLEELARGTILPGGTWVSPPLAPGRYRIELRDREEDQGTVAGRWVSLETEDLDIEFSLARLAINGRLFLGRKPIPGVIHLSEPDSGVRIETAADTDGRFSVILPAAGRWSAMIELHRPRQYCPAGDVEISPGRELEIKLPDGRVTGRVVNADGTAVAKAEVGIFTEDYHRAGSTLSGPDGSFVFRALASGRHTLRAEKEDRASRKQALTLSDGSEVSVIVVLEEGAALRCRITSAVGPVADANVIVFPMSSAGTPTTRALPFDSTNTEGMVTFSLPADSVVVRLHVMAHGYAFRTTGLLPLPARDELLELPLSSQGGTLVLANGLGVSRGTFQILMVDDTPVDVATLLEWCFLNGHPPADRERVTDVPMMPPGQYQLCRLSYSEGLLVMGGLARPKPAACVEGRLAPGGSLVLGFAEPTAEP